MGTYLENYIDSIAMLPQDLYRKFELMRTLDQKSQDHLDAIERDSKDFLQALRRSKPGSQQPENDPRYQAIQESIGECISLGEEKVGLASQTYELVDRHIRRLDEDLKKFATELESKGHGSELEAAKAERRKNKAEANKRQPEQEIKRNKKRRRSSQHRVDAALPAAIAPVAEKQAPAGVVTTHAPPVPGAVGPGGRDYKLDLDLRVDPNEPLYCTCNRYAFGEMIGCDNNDCRVEWFHFECVGLTAQPKGKWYCPECTVLKRRNLLKV